MILKVYSDASYLVLPKSRSRYAGYFWLIDHPSLHELRLHNGAILVECKRIRHIVTSAAKVETTGVFRNANMEFPLRRLLQRMGHKQPSTTIRTDNKTTTVFIKNDIQMKKSKSWDMHLHWLHDRKITKEFNVIWERGDKNQVDYFTKHFSTIYHRNIRSSYVQDKSV